MAFRPDIAERYRHQVATSAGSEDATLKDRKP
jgi:hypothetical protein